jgi:hypothetical protein
MKEIVADAKLVAFCGLYCGACRSYLNEKCPGCRKHEKATWCKVRTCCREAGYSSCAECTTFPDVRDCKKFDNFFSKAIGFILRSDRRACIMQIGAKGLNGHAEDMAFHQRQTIRPQ